MPEEMDDFNKNLLNAIDERIKWFNSDVMPKVQDNYRLHNACVKNIIGVLVKKTLINDDPYKHEKKISDIESPSEAEFTESEKAVVLGVRLSDYESMIDFICSYLLFSVEALTLDKIQKLTNLNNTFNWASLSQNSPKINTRALATVINAAKIGAEPLTISLINDSILKSSKSINDINDNLRILADFQKEIYKGEIRKQILCSSRFNKQKALKSPTEMQIEIKKIFSTVLGKKPYYSDLIDEIILEEIAPDKDKRREKLLCSLKVSSSSTPKKIVVVDNHEILMETIRVIGTMAEQLEQILEKIRINHDILETEHDTFPDRLVKAIRKVLKLKAASVSYEILVIDKKNETQQRRTIDYNQFTSDVLKRAKYYESFSVRKTVGYMRISSLKDDAILAFIDKQLGEINDLYLVFTSLDDFFKQIASPDHRSLIKGIKMELTTLKNIIIKANQHRAEYISIIEEQEQMKKLGIVKK